VDESTRQVEAVDGQGAADAAAQDPRELRREIEHTREELGDTVAALAEKADVKAQARHKVEDVKSRVSSRRGELGPIGIAAALAALLIAFVIARR